MPAMEARFGRCVILAHDLDAAAEAYRDAFGWHTLADVEPESGRRHLHVGPPSQPGVGVWFLPPSGDAGTGRVGAQAGGEPLIALYTDDLAASLSQAEGAGMTRAPGDGEDPSSRWSHLHDPLGNRIVLVEMKT